ncbi:MAG: cell division protein FtsQ [Candidatus Omnitrophica bacterium]|nr:cell division protein FtsQ [Candidatus Omnitrophota bacterium]
MAKRRRRRRIIGLFPSAGRAVWTAARWALTHPGPFLAVSGLAAGLWGMSQYAQRADIFRVAHVELPADSSLRVTESLMGKNLLTLDLRLLADEVTRQQPGMKQVRVVRRLPDTLRLELVPRLPVAQVRLDLPAASAAQAGRWYPVDRDGFILPDGRAEPADSLLRVVGFGAGTAALRAGRENADERLKLALRVAVSLRREAPAIARRLKELNVSDPQQIRFLLDGDTEVRCGSEAELSAHLSRLQAALRVIARHPVDVGYIDVRFQEPVIHPRT